MSVLDHSHLRGFLDRRVRDGVLRRAIDKWLKAGVLDRRTGQPRPSSLPAKIDETLRPLVISPNVTFR